MAQGAFEIGGSDAPFGRMDATAAAYTACTLHESCAINVGRSVDPSELSLQPAKLGQKYFKLFDSAPAAVDSVLYHRPATSAANAVEPVKVRVLEINPTDKQWAMMFMAKKEPRLAHGPGFKAWFHFGKLDLSTFEQKWWEVDIPERGVHSLKRLSHYPSRECDGCMAREVAVYSSMNPRSRQQWYCPSCWPSFVMEKVVVNPEPEMEAECMRHNSHS